MSRSGPGVATARPGDLLVPSRRDVATAAAVAAAVLAGSSTGSVVVAGLLIGLATLDRRAAAAALLATLSASIRFTSGALDDLAGIQSVLGIAGAVGPATAAASAWVAAAAVLLATRAPAEPGGDVGLRRYAPALATGLLAAALVAGPGPDDLAVRVGTSVLGVAAAVALTRLDGRTRLGRVRPVLAVVLGGLAVVLAGWPA